MWNKVLLLCLELLIMIVNLVCDVLEHVTGWRVFCLSEDAVLQALPEVLVKHLLNDHNIYSNFKATVGILHTTKLTPVGEAAFMNQIKMSLETSLYFKEVCEARDLAGQETHMRRPLFLVSMTRTGSTHFYTAC